MDEVRGKLDQWMKQAVALDQWEMLQEARHSTSVVDFFTAANQTLRLVSSLPFTSQELVIQYSEIMMQTTLHYAELLEQLCIKDIDAAKPTTPTTPRQHRRTKSRGLIDSQLSDEDLTSALTPTMTLLPSAFVVKLNDIIASKQQFETITEGIEEIKYQLSETSEVTEESTVDDVTEMSNDDFENLESDTKSAKATPMQSLFIRLDLVIDDLISMLVEQLREMIRSELCSVIDHVQKDIQKNYKKKHLVEKDIVSLYGSYTAESLRKFMDGYLTPQLQQFASGMYTDVFDLVMTKLFALFLSEITDMILPPFSEEKIESITDAQIYALKILVKNVVYYFSGSDNSGLKKQVLEKESRFILQIFNLQAKTTQQAIDLFSKFEKRPNLNKTSALKDHHIVQFLATRASHDKLAAQFCKAHAKKTQTQRVVQLFGLDSGTELLLICKFYTGGLIGSSSTCYLTKTSLCFENPSSRLTNIRAQLYHGSFASPSFGRIYLADITEIQYTSTLMFKSRIRVVFGTSLYTFYFQKKETREQLLDALTKQLGGVGNTKVTITQSESGKGLFSLFSRHSAAAVQETQHEESDDLGTVVGFNKSERNKILLTRLGITYNDDIHLIERIQCSIVADNVNGFLYVFNTCICFESVSPVNGTERYRVISNWNNITSIEKSKTAITIHSNQDLKLKRFGKQQDQVLSLLQHTKQEFLNTVTMSFKELSTLQEQHDWQGYLRKWLENVSPVLASADVSCSLNESVVEGRVFVTNTAVYFTPYTNDVDAFCNREGFVHIDLNNLADVKVKRKGEKKTATLKDSKRNTALTLTGSKSKEFSKVCDQLKDLIAV
jgi:hypothetical protein